MRFVARLYRFVRYVLRFAAYVQLISQPAFRLAQNPAEKATVVRFACKLVLYRGAAVIMRLLQRALMGEDTPLTLQGVKYSVGINSHETTVFGEIYQKHDYDGLPDFVPAAGWTVIDIGANVGIFTVQQALRGARVYAFEPNPDCYRRLSWTIKANALDTSISAFNVAVGAESGQGTMRIDHGFTLGGMVVSQNGSKPTDQSTVTIKALDDVVPSLAVERVSLMKVDTEGAEVDVLRGASQTLKLVDRIIMEYHSHQLRDEVSSLLREREFVVVRSDDHDVVTGRGVLYARRSDAG